MEEKLARICWNNRNWTSPSGREGKSDNIQCYEARYGFGHEEWLFECRVCDDGYCYGHLTPLMADCYTGKYFRIHLFTRRDDGKHFYAGVIENAYRLSEDESIKIMDEYKKKGWLEERKKEVESVGGLWDGDETTNIAAFNVRFKKEDLHKHFEEIDPSFAGNGHRYTLMNVHGDPKFLIGKDELKTREWLGDGSYVLQINSYRTRVKRLHKTMQNMLKAYLNSQKEYTKTAFEVEYIDLVAKTKNGKYHYFELKTNDTARMCIREAMGQILEYCHYHNSKRNVERMFIVGPSPMSGKFRGFGPLVTAKS